MAIYCSTQLTSTGDMSSARVPAARRPWDWPHLGLTRTRNSDNQYKPTNSVDAGQGTCGPVAITRWDFYRSKGWGSDVSGGQTEVRHPQRASLPYRGGAVFRPSRN